MSAAHHGPALAAVGTDGALDHDVDPSPEDLVRAMATITSHELRSPLGMLLTLVESVRWRHDKLGPEDLDELFASMSSTLHRLFQLLDDLSEVQSREPRGLRRSDTPLANAVSRAVADLDMAGHDIDILVRGTARVDGTLFERILSNLVRNAVVHTPTGTTITIEAGPADDGGCILEVWDDGPGAGSDDPDVLFRPFRRGPQSDMRPGTGIGLALVRQFARAHDGDAWIVPDQGFRVRVELGSGEASVEA